ncbi:MAG: 4-phosphoerythronate dehydrogenase [candidate division KSB1 bacterium]|nr:4-phosphoerythronate dehydrogenase [candidate division KSB1 bacterium]
MAQLNLVIDAAIPHAAEAFSEFGRVHLLPGDHIDRAALQRADVLIVRSVTRVNAALLETTPVRFVGSATIGTDHIDVAYLKARGIAFANAAGCNADAVAEYVITAIVEVLHRRGAELTQQSVGIVGVGNIGGRVARLAAALGMRVLKNDPPLQRATGSTEYLPLQTVLGADIVTLHVPLHRSGPDATVHLLNGERLQALQPHSLLINTARGPVIDNSALRTRLQSGNGPDTVLDVWEHEPAPDPELVRRVSIGTPHIAGYSLEGKARATQMVYEALCRHLGRPAIWQPVLPPVPKSHIVLDSSLPPVAALHTLLRHVYDIWQDDHRLREMLKLPPQNRAEYFERLRRTYPLRREFSNFTVRLQPHGEALARMLRALRFQVVEYQNNQHTHPIGE